MPDTRTRVPTVEWRARPTMSMIACLKRLNAVNGRLVRHTRLLIGGGASAGRGWKVEHSEPVLYWFPTATGTGIIARGLVDDHGYINANGLEAIERYDR